MNSEQMREKVSQAVHLIAAEPIHQEIPLAGARNLVLFCGLPMDVELCHTEGDRVVLNGTRASFGPTAEQADASMKSIALMHDRVDDYLTSGPHEGEIFCGTTRDKTTDKPQAIVRTSAEIWTKEAESLLDAPPHSMVGLKETGHYFGDFARSSPAIPGIMGRHLKDALRLSVLRTKIEDVVLPIELVTTDIARLIQINNSNKEQVHGQIGRVSLTIAIPAGCGVTVIGAAMGVGVHAQDLRSSVVLAGTGQATLHKVRGDVLVLGGLAQEVTQISGQYIQSYYGLGGGNSEVWEYRRCDMPGGIGRRQMIRQVNGGLYIDCLQLDLDLADLGGPVHIRNVFGTTRLAKRSHAEGDRVELLTDSGSVEVLLDEKLVGLIGISAISMAGLLQFPALEPLGGITRANDATLMGIATNLTSGPSGILAGIGKAEVFLQCREGSIKIERLP